MNIDDLEDVIERIRQRIIEVEQAREIARINMVESFSARSAYTVLGSELVFLHGVLSSLTQVVIK